MRPIPQVRPERDGFTIVEVLLVTMIMGLMFVSISQLMQMARRTRDRIHNFQETQLAGPAILEMIATDLNGIFTQGRSRGQWVQITDRTVNGLDADRIDFVTTTDTLVVEPTFDPDEEPLRADYNEVGFMLRESVENDEFLEIYRREDLGIDDEPFSGGTYTFLSDQVKGFEIEVFEEDGPDSDAVDEWGLDLGGDDTLGFPAYIKMTLTIELKPRIDAESMDFTGADRRTMRYVRYVRFPELLRPEEGAIPRIGLPPGTTEPAAGGGAGDPNDPNNQGGNNGLGEGVTANGGGRGRGQAGGSGDGGKRDR